MTARLTGMARRQPAAAAAAAFVLGLVAALNLDVIALIAVHVTVNVLSLIALVLLGAHLSGGERRRKKAQRWMLTQAKSGVAAARGHR